MGHRIIKVVQSLQALCEQRAADVERASERGQNHTGPRPSPSRSPRPPWPGQRWRDARREPERPLVRAAVVPPREGTRLGAGGEEEGGERSAERGPSSSFQRARRRRDPLRCRRRPRGVEGMQNKRKREERNWKVRCKGMDVPGELAAGLAVPTQATCGLPLLKLCSS